MSGPYHPSAVIVPLDGSAGSAAALPVARRMAGLLGATLHVLYVADAVVPESELGEHLGLSGEQLQGVVLNEARGPVAEAITGCADAHNAALIVMAMYDVAPAGALGLGHVTEAVLANAPCPLLLVPPDVTSGDWRMRRVLLPQDGTPELAAAVESVARLAHFARAELIVVHVSGAKAALPEPGSLTVPRYMDQPHHEWPEWAQEFVDRIRGLCQLPEQFQPRFFFASGDPGAEVVRLARRQEAELVVLPWHGSLEPHRAETLKDVIQDAPSPLLVLPLSTVGRLKDSVVT